MLIDCDVHISPGVVLELADYTDSATRDLLLHSGTEGFALPDYPWYHPTGWVRKDAYDPQSPDPSMHVIDLAKVQAQVLDPHDVTFGIATPDHIAGGLCVMPNPVIAAKLASAHNDWMLEHYLRARAAAARADRDLAAEPGGGREGDPARRRTRRVRGHLPAGRSTHPVRQPGT